MGLRVNNNIAAINAHRNLSATDVQMSKSLEKLSSGLRINRAADDAAGLAISEGLRAQTGGLKVAVRNAQDGVSVVQTAEGALTETHSILQRMRDLAVQASNDGSIDDTAKKAANVEFSELQAELDRIASTTSFGSQKLLNAGIGGVAGYTGTFQVGAESTGNDRIDVNLSTTAITAMGDTIANGGDGSGITGLDSVGLKVAAAGPDGIAGGANAADDVNISSEDNANAAILLLDKAIMGVSTVRATLGAKQNRFEHTINNLNVAIENVTASESRIRDTDMAQEMASFTRSQILSQAGTAMLAQANQGAQGVLRLLG
jgi:flagellin